MPGKGVFICGSSSELAMWNPSDRLMNRRSASVYTFSIEAVRGKQLAYKYTLGSWDSENCDGKGFPLSNFTVTPNSDTTVTDTVLFWKNTGITKEPTVTGTLIRIEDFGSGKIKKRGLLVWLPPGYDSTRRKGYPVLYMHDGQNLFDRNTSSFGNEWKTDETADSLIRKGSIPPMIIVGINNTSDRMEEYTPGQKGKLYTDFIIDEVKPFIDRHYKTNSGRAATYTAGSSAGGTVSFMLAWNHPEIFSKAFCFSPAFRISSIDLVTGVKEYTGKKKKISLYIDNGGKELEARLRPGIDSMIEALKDIGYSEGRDLMTFFDLTAEHNEKAWAKRLPAALEKMLGKKIRQ
jgi:predicted alpha/beta superfamily hydrolase